MARARLDGTLKAQGISHTCAGSAGQQAHRTPPARIACATRYGAVMLRKATFHMAGNAAVQGAVRAFQQVNQPQVGCHVLFHAASDRLVEAPGKPCRNKKRKQPVAEPPGPGIGNLARSHAAHLAQRTRNGAERVKKNKTKPGQKAELCQTDKKNGKGYARSQTGVGIIALRHPYLPQRRPPGLKASRPAPAEGATVKKAPAAGIAPAMPLAGAVSLILPVLLLLPVIKDNFRLEYPALVIAGIAVFGLWAVVLYGGQIVIVSGMPA